MRVGSFKLLSSLAVIGVVLLTLGGAFFIAVDSRTQSEYIDAQRDGLQDVFRLSQLAQSESSHSEIDSELAMLATDPRVRQVLLADPQHVIRYALDRQLLGQGLDSQDGITPELLQALHDSRLGTALVDKSQQSVLVGIGYTPLEKDTVRSSQRGLVLIRFQLHDTLRQMSWQVAQVFVWPAAMLLLLVLLLGWLAQRYVLGPLGRLRLAVLDYAANGSLQPLPQQGVSEVRGLLKAFNAMQQHLQDTLDMLKTQRLAAAQLAQEREALLQAIPDHLFEMSPEGRFLQVWSSSQRGLAESREQLLGKLVHQVMPLDAADTVCQAIGEALAEGVSRGRRICLFVDCQPRWFELSAARKEAAGSEVSCILLAHDSTLRKHAEDELQLWAQVFAAAHNGILVTDSFRNIVQVNAAFTRITGYAAEDIVGKTPSILSSGRHDQAFYHRMWQEITTRGHWQGEIWNRRKSGEIFPEWQSISAVRGEDGEISHYISVFSDISSQKEAEQYIRRLAYFDSLTGLPNRALLQDHASQALSLSRHDDTPLALMFIDLDRFKNINDTLGHSIGDQLLVEVGRRLLALLQEKDTLTRLGGDEFIILLPETDESAAGHLAERVVRELSTPYHLSGYELITTPSIGIAMAPVDGSNLEELLRAADAAMYRAKAEGRSTFRFFTAQMQQRSAARLKLEAELRRALEKRELQLYYQPQSDMHGHLIGIEALLRWQHPELGMVAPVEFIPLAEESGLIVPIGMWVLEEAIAQMRNWRERGIHVPIVGVNLSALQFRQPMLVEQVARLLHEAALPAECLELELTESLVLDDPDDALGLMERLHQQGVRLAIDDFGTGYSSLNYLRRFPVDRLKIDRSFVQDLAQGRGIAIVRAIISLAHSLGFVTIAEGVETPEQLEQLRRLRCDQVQGFLFARPMSVRNLEDWLLRHRSVGPDGESWTFDI
ncbi:EAL domain-containing protein [Vogesella sp. LIG4]|uniref:bifunctional diguanylate cyclase/phosphodiesterase n=1 Tax=Vogesella sp. LIG4 TaxID=1192162 RepID=UPI000820072E|nr:EAL domain-containing protein [Vogesella sp. LIG4]SCK23379.1 PAS domain S-box-containing protein/diguanylate cyclase (GGDEF) domain-containing protein [Vogesella sp. LIG4]